MNRAADLATPRPLAALLTAALIAGLLAGLLATALQAALVWPLIAQAEILEDAATAPTTAAPAGHDHHDAAAPAPLIRAALSALTNIAVAVGYALLLAAAMLISHRRMNWRHGLLWGGAGYLVVVGAPALGLQPVPPGVETGALLGRQLWWLASALCTAAGLAALLLVRGRHRLVAAIGGVALLIVPHAIGAPVDVPHGSAPLELRRQFAVMVLLTAAPSWLLSGALLGWLLGRHQPDLPSRATSRATS